MRKVKCLTLFALFFACGSNSYSNPIHKMKHKLHFFDNFITHKQDSIAIPKKTNYFRLKSCTDQFNDFNTTISQLSSIGVQSCYVSYGTDYDGGLNCALAVTQTEIQYYSLSRTCYSSCNSGGSFYPCMMSVQ